MNNQRPILKDEPTGRQRTAFLIRCTEAEASRIRREAESHGRTISGYVVAVLGRCIKSEQLAKADLRTIEPVGTRTALLIRCSVLEADQVRMAVRREGMSISSFALHCLRQSWNLDRTPAQPPLSSTQTSIPYSASDHN